jgi:2-C-methyl-D-erythritol 4-phosphate cytidylyltransferase
MVSAIIVAAGRGTRMGPDRDKLFLDVAGLPVIAHTWRRFDHTKEIADIVLVVRDGMQKAFQELAGQCKLTKPFRLVAGGAERQDSVWNGLAALKPEVEIVCIQDGARPCTSFEIITATIHAAREMGAAVAARPVTDTIKESADGALISRTLDRAKLWSVQTPQTFRVEIIRHALTLAREKHWHLTDDTAACELTGHPVKLVTGTAPNPKVTVPEDLHYIELLLKRGVE